MRSLLLLVGAVMGVFMGGYLERQARLRTDAAAIDHPDAGDYLPHASIWPFASRRSSCSRS